MRRGWGCCRVGTAGSGGPVAGHRPAPQPHWWWLKEADVRKGENAGNVRSEEKSVKNSLVSTEVGESRRRRRHSRHQGHGGAGGSCGEEGMAERGC